MTELERIAAAILAAQHDPQSSRRRGPQPPRRPRPTPAEPEKERITMPALEIIARLPFRDARAKDRFGRPQVPHQYTVRAPATEADYVALWNAIEAHGVFARYGGQVKRYLHPGDARKYWHMGPLYQSVVINRMRLADDLERMRRQLRDETAFATRRAREDGCAYLITPLGHVLADTPEHRRLAEAELEGIVKVIQPGGGR
jgi:hypothetical protein